MTLTLELCLFPPPTHFSQVYRMHNANYQYNDSTGHDQYWIIKNQPLMLHRDAGGLNTMIELINVEGCVPVLLCPGATGLSERRDTK